MYIPFEQMPAHARVWVYQANRNLEEGEVSVILEKCKDFLARWTAHKQNLYASTNVFYARFLVIALDEERSAASGCSIDASVHFIKSLEKDLHLDFFDRTKIAFLEPTSQTLFVEDMKDLKQKVAEGIIQNHTLVFNNLVENLAQLQNEWKVPAQQSWLLRYFN